MNKITFYEERFTYNEEWQGDVDIYADGIYQSSFAEDSESKFYGDPILKLAEYEDLEEQGLLYRLPCKIGDIVFVIVEECEDIYVPDSKYYTIYPEYFALYMIEEIGKSVFLTEPEAEAALKAMQEGE